MHRPLVAMALGALTSASGCRDRAGARAIPLAPSTPPATLAAGPSASQEGAGRELAGFKVERVTGEGRAMGTHLAFAAFTRPGVDAARARDLFEAATAEIVRLEKLMTTWDPASEVSRINAEAGQRPVVVGEETFDVIAESLHASAISRGAFDITFETLHGLWKFDQDLDPHPPSPQQVASRLRYVGYTHVKLDPPARSVFLDESHVRIGLGGIAKGYAVDRASKVLLDGGLVSFYVQAGGDLYAHGTKPDGVPWLAGVRDPRGPETDYFAMMPVLDHAFSTAGDYERGYIAVGKRYHHIIDPHTGYPATASRSVTIWAPTALLADELDDAVFILGPEKGLALIESLEDVGGVIVDGHNRVWLSNRLQGRLQEVHPPKDEAP